MLARMKTLALAVVVMVGGSAWAQSTANAEVHVVEKQEGKAGRFEVALFPAATQLNGRFTQHVGTFGTVTWHVAERFALQILGGGNWFNTESSFNSELVAKYNIEAQAAESLLWTWGVFAGVEVEPFFAKFTIANGPIVHFGLVLSGGAGAGATRHQLKGENSTPATYGDTGARFMGTFAAGFRVALGKNFTVRLDVRDVAYSARMDRINGCSAADAAALNAGGTASSPQCTGFNTPTDRSIANSLLKNQGSAVLHNVGLYLGGGFTF